MHEQADVRIGDVLPNEAGDEEAVVVVDPDEIAGLVQLDDALGVRLVSALIRLPVLILDWQLGSYILP